MAVKVGREEIHHPVRKRTNETIADDTPRGRAASRVREDRRRRRTAWVAAPVRSTSGSTAAARGPRTGSRSAMTGSRPSCRRIFGATAAFFFTPTFGLRLHGAYMPQNLPENEDANIDFDSGWVVEQLAVRPGPGVPSLDRAAKMRRTGWRRRTSSWAAAATRPTSPGESIYPGCLGVALWLANGVCVSDRPSLATTGQGVVGFGVDMFPVGSALALFIEGAVHGYDSPAHVQRERAERRRTSFTFTPRLVLGLKAMFGNLIPPPPPPPPPPPIPPPPPAAAAAAAAAGRGRRATSGCAWWRTARCVTITRGLQHADRRHHGERPAHSGARPGTPRAPRGTSTTSLSR